MINPNGDDFTKHDPIASSPNLEEGTSSSASRRFDEVSSKVSSAAGDAWRQTRATAGNAREKTEHLMRENPIPTVIGALALGVAIGLAIRYGSRAEEEVEVKSPLGNVNLGMLSLPFLWPFFKTMKSRYEDSAEVVKDRVQEGVDRLRSVDVDRYVKPLRKKWRAWAN